MGAEERGGVEQWRGAFPRSINIWGIVYPAPVIIIFINIIINNTHELLHHIALGNSDGHETKGRSFHYHK